MSNPFLDRKREFNRGANPQEIAAKLAAEQKANPRTQEPAPASSGITTLRDYIILPGRAHGNYEYPDLLVAKTPELYVNYSQSATILALKGSFILTIRQYADLIKYLAGNEPVYDGAGKKLDAKELTNMKHSLTGTKNDSEYLDAFITKIVNSQLLQITYDIIKPGRTGIRTCTEPLEACLMEDADADGRCILEELWLNNSTKHGFPKVLPPGTNQNKNGTVLFYRYPRENEVGLITRKRRTYMLSTTDPYNPSRDQIYARQVMVKP